jgi:RNA polymerase primary sigma factor
MLTTIASEGRTQQMQQVLPLEHQEIRERTEALLRNEVQFIPNGFFVGCGPEDEKAVLRVASQIDRSGTATEYPRDLPAHLARLCEPELLTAEQERELFRAMNYSKYRVNVLQTQIDPECPDRKLVETAESFLKAASEIRDRIIQANMRLVLSIVKKFVTPQYSFDELLSDGIDTLIRTVCKFDFDRGFRFSTYAYRSIARRAYHQITARQKDSGRFTGAVDDLATDPAEDSERQLFNEASWDELRAILDNMLSRLDDREQYIIRRRYAMGAARKAETFQSMANQLGVSKERVRQLERQAVGKLRNMAGEMGMSSLLE